MPHSDIIVVGSGTTGAMAAQTLVEGGSRVLMLDGGQTDTRYAGLIPEKSFMELRRSDPNQHRYLLGDEFESVLAAPGSTGAQLTPPRRFILSGVDRFLPIESANFHPMESLALGGLGSGWGLGCCVFSDKELRDVGLPPAPMRDAYQIVASRIGISGDDDDARPYTYAYLQGIQPSAPLDPTATAVYSRYLKKRDRVRREGFYMGRPALALLTQPRDGRGATQLRELDFYSDAERAAWRPWITIEALAKNDRFSYAGNRLVTRFEERENSVSVVTLNMQDRSEEVYTCRRLVLAAGTLGTARIVLRSVRGPDGTLPILCNPFVYVPCLVPSRIGKPAPDRVVAGGQLMLFHDPDGRNDDVAIASIYTYRSLMLFRLLREVPLDLQDARLIMRAMVSGMVVMAVQHPESWSAGKWIALEPDPGTPTGDRLRANYELTAGETARIEWRERLYLRTMRGLGAWPLRRLHPGHGSSIHYAGTLPFDGRNGPYSLAPDGRVNGTKSVYAADGSGFTSLPAKALTLTLMANAHRVARGLL